MIDSILKINWIFLTPTLSLDVTFFLSESELPEFKNFQNFIVSGIRSSFPKHRFSTLAKVLE